MGRTSAALVGVLVVATMFSLVPAEAQSQAPQAIGRFDRVIAPGDLTEDDLAAEGDGLRLDAPSFASKLRVNASYLQERLGAWAADRAFDVVDGRAVFSGDDDVRLRAFVPDGTPRFTMGSADSIQFAERPMWVSVTPEGESLRLDFDDGDTTGQHVRLAKTWLWSHGIHRPTATHEDGSEVPVVESEDRRAYVLHMPHFSWTLLSAADISVLGRSGDGPLLPHAGQVRWDAEGKTLEIDVATQVQAYEVWVETEWFNANMPHPALIGGSWTIGSYEEADYFVLAVSPAETPATMVFRAFTVPLSNAYTRGSLDLVRLTSPAMISIGIDGGELNITLPGLGHGVFVTANATWLIGLGITRPSVGSSEGPIPTWGVLDNKWFQAPIPPNATFWVLGQDDDEIAPVMALIDLEAALGDKCREALGDNAKVDEFDRGDSKAGIYVRGATFCFEWYLYSEEADWYNVQIFLNADDGSTTCGSGQESGMDVKSQEGFLTCKWPDGEEFPTGRVNYRLIAKAHWQPGSEYLHPNWERVVSGVLCAAGSTAMVLATYASAGIIWAAPPVQYIASAIVGICIAFFIGEAAVILDEFERATGRILILGEGNRTTLIGTNQVHLVDPGMKRGDSWSSLDLEYRVARPDAWDGWQSLIWTLKDMEREAQLRYSTDLSIIPNGGMRYDHGQVELFYGAGGAWGNSTVNSFSGNAGGTENTLDLSTRYDNGADALDWEVPEPHCILLNKIVATVNGEAFFLGLGPIVPAQDCPGLSTFGGGPEEGSAWLEFELVDSNLPPSQIVATTGTITGQDVLNETGNITRAIAKKLVNSQAFIDNIHHVEVTPMGGPVGPCNDWETLHQSPFSVTVSGTSLAGAIPVNDADSLIAEICFDPLLGLIGDFPE